MKMREALQDLEDVLNDEDASNEDLRDAVASLLRYKRDRTVLDIMYELRTHPDSVLVISEIEQHLEYET